MATPASRPDTPAPPVIVKHVRDASFFCAGDRCTLAEILNPNNAADRELGLPYSLAIAYVEPGERTLNHVLAVSEIYFVIEGEGVLWLGGAPHPVESGSVVYVPAGCAQWLENTGPGRIRFLCIVSPAWEPSVERLLSD